jgi:hypothetical protein
MQIIQFMLFASFFGALAIVAKLTSQRQRAWVERDLNMGDLRALSGVAFRRNVRPASIIASGRQAVLTRRLVQHLRAELSRKRNGHGTISKTPPNDVAIIFNAATGGIDSPDSIAGMEFEHRI